MSTTPSKQPSLVPGLAIMGCIIVGILGLVLSFNPAYLGIPLVASAISFGFLVSTCFQK